MKTYVGIDISSTSTGLFSLIDNEIYFNYLIQPKYKNIDKRYLEIKKVLFKILNRFDKKQTIIGIESPSFFSKGRIVTLASGWGYIYYSLLEKGYKVVTVTPSKLKKFATGNGRATKDDMYSNLSDEIKLEIDSLSYKKKDDLVDAYWIAKFVYNLDKNKGE